MKKGDAMTCITQIDVVEIGRPDESETLSSSHSSIGESKPGGPGGKSMYLYPLMLMVLPCLMVFSYVRTELS